MLNYTFEEDLSDDYSGQGPGMFSHLKMNMNRERQLLARQDEVNRISVPLGSKVLIRKHMQQRQLGTEVARRQESHHDYYDL